MSDKTNYVIFNPEGGLGKIIASTAVVRAIKQKYPDHKIIVISPWFQVFDGNPNIYRAFPSGNTPFFYQDYILGRESIVLKGEPYFNTKHLYQKQSLAESWCGLFDLPFDGNNNPELFYNDVEIKSLDGILQGDKPILMMQTNGGPYESTKKYCWTRDLPFDQVQILANELSKNYTIVQVARPNCNKIPNAVMVNDLPDKRVLLGLLLKTEKRILIDSCLQHAAAAFNLPSTVCWVGTSPKVFGYELHNNILPNIKKLPHMDQTINSIFFDHDFNGPEAEYPFESSNIFNLQDIYDSIVK